jgi:hypothetical protein
MLETKEISLVLILGTLKILLFGYEDRGFKTWLKYAGEHRDRYL